MQNRGCPNCGHDLVVLREEEQQADSRRVWLLWLTCIQCGHVMLDSWGFADDGVAAPGDRADDNAGASRKASRAGSAGRR